MDEGPYERVLRQVLGVGGSEQSPAETQDGPLEAEHQRVESRRVAAAGATRKVNLCSPVVRTRARGRCIAGLYDRTLLADCQESTGDGRGLFRGDGSPDGLLGAAGRPLDLLERLGEGQ